MAGWEHVNPGDPWRPPQPELHNAMIDVAKHHRGRMVSSIPASSVNRWREPVSLLNATGGQLLRGEAVAYRDTEFEATDDDWRPFETPVLTGTVPVWPDDAGRLAICLGTIEDGDVGDVMVSGLAFAKVEVVDVNHRWVWFADEDPNWLKTGDAGQMKIVGKVPAIGTGKYILVDLDREQPLWRFEVTAYDAWKLAYNNGDLTDQEFDLTDVFDLFARVDEEGWKGYVQWIDGLFLPAGAPCEKP